MKCTPTGSPPSVACSGTDIAGWPVTFTIAVNGVQCHLEWGGSYFIAKPGPGANHDDDN